MKKNKHHYSTWSGHLHLGYHKIIRDRPFRAYNISTWTWNYSSSRSNNLNSVVKEMIIYKDAMGSALYDSSSVEPNSGVVDISSTHFQFYNEDKDYTPPPPFFA